MASALPRVVVAGLAGDTGKTLVSLGLIRSLRRQGQRVAPFKKGPDFIDAAWLGAAAGKPGRNLDTFLMEPGTIRNSVARMAAECDLAIVEGNRGLYDGLDARGSHSTASLAKCIDAPVILVVDVTKSTRTVAAQILGCQRLDPDVRIAGIILNRVGTARQEKVIREAVATDTALPVIGSVPRMHEQHLPSRHLGLVTAMEHPTALEALERVAGIVEQHVDLAAVASMAGRASLLEAPPRERKPKKPGVRIGVLRDPAFSFYYPENIEALESEGAEIVELSPLADEDLAAIDGLYAGGGFPEVYAAALSANTPFREAVAGRIHAGMPVWAECGGLMYLSRSLSRDGTNHPMAGVLPIACEQRPRPQGHGYVELRVDVANPFFREGMLLRGHEFHYSRLAGSPGDLATVFEVRRGEGLGSGRDGILHHNVVATYTHLHALGVPSWAANFVRAAEGQEKLTACVQPVPLAVPRRRPYREPGMAAPGRRSRTLRIRVEEAVRAGDVDALHSIVSVEPRAVRYLVSMSYKADSGVRRWAAKGIALAGRHHPELVQGVVRRLVWAMNDESGTNAATAPEVLQAISTETPALLLPVVPDLVRLAGDAGLHTGIAEVLRRVVRGCPGEVGRSLGEELTRQMEEGASCANG